MLTEQVFAAVHSEGIGWIQMCFQLLGGLSNLVSRATKEPGCS